MAFPSVRSSRLEPRPLFEDYASRTILMPCSSTAHLVAEFARIPRRSSSEFWRIPLRCAVHVDVAQAEHERSANIFAALPQKFRAVCQSSLHYYIASLVLYRFFPGRFIGAAGQDRSHRSNTMSATKYGLAGWLLVVAVAIALASPSDAQERAGAGRTEDSGIFKSADVDAGTITITTTGGPVPPAGGKEMLDDPVHRRWLHRVPFGGRPQ